MHSRLVPALGTQGLLESAAVLSGHEVVKDGVDRAGEVVQHAWRRDGWVNGWTNWMGWVGGWMDELEDG